MRLAEIWRHPIKGHGREALDGFDIAEDGTVPGDRVWAVVHEASKQRGAEWAPAANFQRGAKLPALMAITAESGTDAVTLHHPERPDLTFDPDGDNRVFLDWIAPLLDPGRASPTGIVRSAERGYTDTDFPSISLNNVASLDALAAYMGRDLSRHRWRGNLWIDGAAPWAEFEWIGREVALGTARFRVAERITRCRATMADPETGRIDGDTLGALEAGWGHRDFGVYLTCLAPGRVETGDELVLQ
ncbi:MOSC N-terminal beta barrel domain-containing protein [uncultured Jannaschia sp.]|uniref:MOSC domain-containing protein n=1 Tax=uncultured Jannaschia sp. TaxID=293347 RepID=UPI00262BE91B|nr:MOSC N-terminal beta barrel domain-containing protein [uncultured Jannaschia sp.]